MISGRVIRKYYDYIVTKFKVLREQKVYKFDEINLKYIYKTFFPDKKDVTGKE